MLRRRARASVVAVAVAVAVVVAAALCIRFLAFGFDPALNLLLVSILGTLGSLGTFGHAVDRRGPFRLPGRA